ncbi:Anaerobic glycerol-3-phosphate dehydrogenase subunit A [Raoultella planticola]|uniref:Anaerobic glycerol-3-phosphate dehydrogenase subunit A n=1 Tax=Raoultella planticola TaxID=575 RepID=A0A485AK62_RAOPL|nr:Anaerobic glycerol-3-phosphate dehydrogenase subunit A [Raoultella planticola]
MTTGSRRPKSTPCCGKGKKLAPVLGRTRVLRAYSGVRPLVASDDDPSGRSVSRGIVLLDHAGRDGMEGFITITGGKLMTYRLMGGVGHGCRVS